MSERVRLNVRVPEDIKNAYDDAILDKYGISNTYAGMELERELRISFDMGQESEMFDSLRSLVDNPSEKNNSAPRSFAPGEVSVQYRVHPDVRAKLKQLSQEGAYSMGSIVAKAMYGYSIDRGYQDRMLEYVQDLEEDDVQDDELSATERTERDIAEYLKENHGKEDIEMGWFVSFKIEDFDTAAKKAGGVKTQEHARGKYLKDVLERLELNPMASGVFFPKESGAKRDLRGLPYDAMDDSDMITALRAELLERGERAVLTTDKERGKSRVPTVNPVDVLGKRPRELDSILEEVAEAAGFNYKPPGSGWFDSAAVEVVSITQAKESYNSDDKALELAGLIEDTEPETDDVQDPTEGDPAEAKNQPVGVMAD